MKLKVLLPLFAIALLAASCKSEPKTEEELIAYAKDIHDRVITLDTHCDINVANFTDSINYTQRLKNQVNLPKMIEGGLDVPWFIVYTGQDSLSREGFEKAYDNAMSKFNAIHRLVKDYAPDQIELATTSDDVRRIIKSGKKAAMIGIENGYPIGLNIENVQKFYDLGARYMSLSHNGHSQLCDSNTGEADGKWLHNGLSDFGKLVIEEMNRVGMMIDVSHPSKEAMRQMIELTKAPIIASHSSARALCDHSRNLDDEQLQWLKENGGVVQTVAFKTYLSKEKSEARNAKTQEIRNQIADSMGVKYYGRREFRALDKALQDSIRESGYLSKINELAKVKIESMSDFPPEVNVSDFVDHIDYLVEKIGLGHVGISSDFDGGGGVEGWSDASETFNVTLELVRRGYTEKEIEQLWSGNLLRVLDECQSVAESLK
ncbi:membrane dipeptidase [Winogradskyella wandonensis]|uniref:Membrane dipeptidase n=1 Tax=Winogradskyella wandonensis TaxID=1442586 RepID=A0A4R1KVT1_9FLAO|nr:dipeptidase [Winogradskyella wandonensis]TCK69278.1 membrane dipeptidase [Winogradskyella wandonensis]